MPAEEWVLKSDTDEVGYKPRLSSIFYAMNEFSDFVTSTERADRTSEGRVESDAVWAASGCNQYAEERVTADSTAWIRDAFEAQCTRR